MAPGDTEKEINTIANKVLKMKLWDDEAGGKVRPLQIALLVCATGTNNHQWKKNVMDINGEVLCGMNPLTLTGHLLAPVPHDYSQGDNKRMERGKRRKLTDVYAVSQFTLLAKTKKGTKPDFHGAMNPEEASRLYHMFVQKVKEGYEADRVKDGRFQAMMEVELVNDGPVSLYFCFPVSFTCWLCSWLMLGLGYTGAERGSKGGRRVMDGRKYLNTYFKSSKSGYK